MGLYEGKLTTREIITKIIEEKEGEEVTFLDMMKTCKKYNTPLTVRIMEYFVDQASVKNKKVKD